MGDQHAGTAPAMAGRGGPGPIMIEFLTVRGGAMAGPDGAGRISPERCLPLALPGPWRPGGQGPAPMVNSREIGPQGPHEGMIVDQAPTRRARRGTSNTNARGSAASRRARRAWIMDAYGTDGIVTCWWCDVPLHADGPEAFEVDRLVPGRRGGTYRRGNVVPACPPCNADRGNADRDGLIW